MKIYIYVCVSVIWILFQDVSTYIHHKVVDIESCPDLGYFLVNDTDLSFGHNVCNLCFCKDNGSAVCWERQAYKCSPIYSLELTRIPRARRSPFGWSDIFGHDSSKPVFAKENKQECQPYESSYSEGCPPDDWCIGCTVCDCSSEGRWDCHVLSFCGDNKKGGKEMLSKIPRNVLKKMNKKNITKKTLPKKKTKIIPKATQKKPSTTKPKPKTNPKLNTIKNKSIATVSSKKAKAKINIKSGTMKKGTKVSNKNISKSMTKKVIKKHELPTNIVTVKPPETEKKTIMYFDKKDNSTVKFAKILIQKIFARIGKDFKLLLNNDTDVPIPPCKQSTQNSVMMKLGNSRKRFAKNPSKRELYKNEIYRSKRSNDPDDITIESVSDIIPYGGKPLSLPLMRYNITAEVDNDIKIQINNYTKYENTIVNSSSEAVVVNDALRLNVSTQTSNTKNVSDLMSETNLLTIPLQDSGDDGTAVNDSNVNMNITKPSLLIIVENITSTTPNITKYKPMSRKSRIFTDNIYVMPSFLNDLKLKMHLLKMLYGVNEILPEQKSYEFNKDNNNTDNTDDVTDKSVGDATSKRRKCSNIKKEKENKTKLICKAFGTCNLNEEKILLLKTKLQSLKSDVLEIMYVMSSIKSMLKDIENNSGYHKIDRRAYKKLSEADVAVVESFGPPRTHTEIIEKMKRDIKYFLKRLDQFGDQFKSAAKELDRNGSLSNTMKNENYRTDKTRKTKKVNRIYRKKIVKQLDRLLMKYNLPRNTFLKNIAQALYEHDRRTNSTVKLVNSRHPFSKGANYITSREYANKLLRNMRLLKVISEKLNTTKFREKRQISSEDSTLNYLLTLLEIVVKQKFEAKDDDGLDTLIDAIKSAPDIKPMRKSYFELTTSTNDYVAYTSTPTFLHTKTENHESYIETYHKASEEALPTGIQKPMDASDDDESTFKDITMPDTIVNIGSQTDSTVPQDVLVQTTQAANIKEFYKTLFRLQNDETKDDETKDKKLKPTIEKKLMNSTKHSSIEEVIDINDTSTKPFDESTSNENSIISSRIGIPWAESTEELISNTNKEKSRDLKFNADPKTYELKQINSTQDVSNVSGPNDDKILSDEDSSKDDNDEDEIINKKQNDLLASLDYVGGEKADDGNQEEKVASDVYE